MLILATSSKGRHERKGPVKDNRVKRLARPLCPFFLFAGRAPFGFGGVKIPESTPRDSQVVLHFERSKVHRGRLLPH